MKASDLPALPPARVRKPIPQSEIDRINDLYASMRRNARQLLKDALEIGDWFNKVRSNLPREKAWYEWLRENFPKISASAIWRFEKLAKNREFVETIIRENEILTLSEALRMVQQKDNVAKPRVRAVVVKADAEPIVLLEAKLKNYVINLYLLRYLEVEVKGMLEAMDLSPDRVLKVLRYVCKEHHEVEEEVLRTFRPELKIVPKDA